MSNTINIFEPRTMLKFVERLPKRTTFLRDTFFTGREFSTTPKVDIDIKKGSRKIAPFVNEKIGGKIVENSGYETKTFQPPLVAPYKVTTAADIMSRSMGENVYSSKTPDQRAAEKVIKDLQELEEMVTRREEVMCAQAIFAGKIDVKGEAVDLEIDFNFTNKETLVGTQLWNTATATRLADLKRWRRQVQQKGFVNTDVVVMSPDVVDEFLKDKDIRELLDNRNMTIGQVNIQELPSGATYIGTINGIGRIYEYGATYYDEVTKAEKPYVPAGTLALLSSEVEFSMAYAAITIMKGEDFVTFEADRVPDSWSEKNPARKFVQLNSKPLPIPKEVDSWFVAQVL